MNTSKADLKKYFATFENVVGSLLREIGYTDSEIEYQNLDRVNGVFPDLPHGIQKWVFEEMNMILVLTIYDNSYTSIQILNNSKSLTLADYIKLKSLLEPLMYNQTGTIEQKYRAYLVQLCDIMQGQFKSILEGQIWLDIPFDWQGHK